MNAVNYCFPFIGFWRET